MAQQRVFRRVVRSSVATVALAALCVAAPLAAMAAAPAVALAATPTYTLGNTAVAVKTSNGETWDLSIVWTEVVAGSASFSVGLERTVTTGGAGFEEHAWMIPVKSTTFTFNSSTEVGTLNATSETTPLATVDLNFKGTSKKAATCTSGSEEIYSGTLSGKIALVTGLTGGGTVGSTTKTTTFNLGTPEVKSDLSCIPPTTVDCANTSDFVSTLTPKTSPDGVGINGEEEGISFDYVGVDRGVTISKPAGTTREDGAGIEKGAMSYNKTTKVFSVGSSTAGIITGSATLTGGTVKTTTTTCTSGGKKVTLTETFDDTAKYTSPTGKSLTAHTSLTGTLTVASNTTGAYGVTTIS
ncbi:MAG: hypothetical protein ABSH30_02840 [Acidimicrobiales bacterium]